MELRMRLVLGIGLVLAVVGCGVDRQIALPTSVSKPLQVPVAGPPREPILRMETGMHSGDIYSLDIDADNRFAVTGSMDKTVRVWELSSGTLVKVLRVPIADGSEGIINVVAISPDGKTVACGGFTGGRWEEKTSQVVYLFDVATGRLVKRLDKLAPAADSYGNAKPAIWSLKFSKDGRHLVATMPGVGLNEGRIRVYRASDWSLLAEETAIDAQWVDFDSAGRLVVMQRFFSNTGDVGMKYFVRLYSADLKLIAELKVPGLSNSMFTPVRFSPDGSKIALVSEVGKITILSGKDLSHLATLDHQGLPVDSQAIPGMTGFRTLAWSPDGKGLVAGGSYRQDSRVIIRKWTDALISVHSDLAVAINGALFGVWTLRDGRIVYLTGREVGLLARDGLGTILTKTPDLPLLGEPHGLLLSQDGMVMGYPSASGGHNRMVFDLARLQLRSGTGQNEKLVAPVVQAPWFSLKEEYRWRDGGAYFAILELTHTCNAVSLGHAVTPDGDSVVLGTVDPIIPVLERCDKQGRKLWSKRLPGMVVSVNVTQGGRHAVAALNDGTIRWYNLHNGEEAFALFAHSDGTRWIVWTPEGYYDAAPGAEGLIGWHVNQGKDQEARFYPVSQFHEKFYRPDVIATVIKTGESAPQALAKLGDTQPLNIQAGIKAPPSVRILSPKAGDSFDTSDVEIQIQAADQGGGVDEIRLYHNGKVVGTDTRDLAVTAKAAPAGSLSKAFRVRLTEGANILKAVAFSKDRIESNPDELTIQLKAVGKPAALHLLLVGINEYKNPALNLNYALPDAQGVRKFFATAPAKLFKEVKRHELYDKAATKAAIVGKLQELQATAPQDVVVIYLAGHGESLDNTWYFIPYEIVTPEKEEQVKSQGLSSVELKDQVAKIGAQKVLVLIDACKSGSAMLAFASRGVEDRKAMAQLARATGTHVVAASTKDQFAAEVKDLGHGVFTYTLLDGLSGKADGAPKDGTVTVRELLSYVESRLPEISEKYKQQAQYPVVDSRGQDFPLAAVR